MKNLTHYLSFTNFILKVAKDFVGTVILTDEYNFYIDAGIYRKIIENIPDKKSIKTLDKVIHILTNQNNIDLLTIEGYIVGTLTWSEEDNIYKQIDKIY